MVLERLIWPFIDALRRLNHTVQHAYIPPRHSSVIGSKKKKIAHGPGPLRRNSSLFVGL